MGEPDTGDDVEELLRLARGGPGKPQKYAPTYMHLPLIRKWVDFYGFKPGVYPSGKSSDLYAHFSMWVREEMDSHLAGEMGGRLREDLRVMQTFTRALKRMGFQAKKVKSRVSGRVQREYCMSLASSDFLCPWIAQNGPKPRENPWYPASFTLPPAGTPATPPKKKWKHHKPHRRGWKRTRGPSPGSGPGSDPGSDPM